MEIILQIIIMALLIGVGVICHKTGIITNEVRDSFCGGTGLSLYPKKEKTDGRRQRQTFNRALFRHLQQLRFYGDSFN